MPRTVIGELKEMLIVITDEKVIGYPKGTVVEILTDEKNPSYTTNEDIEKVALYLSKLK